MGSMKGAMRSMESDRGKRGGSTVAAKTQPKVGGKTVGTSHPNPKLPKIGSKVKGTSKPNVAIYHATRGKKS